MSKPPFPRELREEFAAAHLIRGAQVAMDSLVEDAFRGFAFGKGWKVS